MNGGLQRCRTQVHIPLRHRQVFVSCQLLKGLGWSAPHGKVRAKRMTQQMHAMLVWTCSPRCRFNASLHNLPSQRRPVVLNSFRSARRSIQVAQRFFELNEAWQASSSRGAD